MPDIQEKKPATILEKAIVLIISFVLTAPALLIMKSMDFDKDWSIGLVSTATILLYFVLLKQLVLNRPLQK